MKKFIISVMIVCISATFLFAETPALLGNNENPFNGVDGVELTDTETQDVDGEGGIGVVVGAAAGAGTEIAYQMIVEKKKFKQLNTKKIVVSAALGALGGAVGSYKAPVYKIIHTARSAKKVLDVTNVITKPVLGAIIGQVPKNKICNYIK